MTPDQVHELEERIEGRLKSLDIVIKLGWSLIAGAFLLGDHLQQDAAGCRRGSSSSGCGALCSSGHWHHS